MSITDFFTEEVGHSWTLLIKMAEVILTYLGYCKVESFLAFSMTGSSLESWFENWGPTSVEVKRATCSLLRYKKSFSMTSAILPSKVQPYLTSSGQGLLLFIMWMMSISTYVHARGFQLKEHVFHTHILPPDQQWAATLCVVNVRDHSTWINTATYIWDFSFHQGPLPTLST